MSNKRREKTNFNQLKMVYETLHGPCGCLWDKEQTWQSLVPKLKEEVEEFTAAIRDLDYLAAREELGDLLLLVMFFAKIAAKEGRFDIEDVIESLIAKLKRRHPHVFGNKKLKTTQEIIVSWNEIKEKENKKKKGREKKK